MVHPTHNTLPLRLLLAFGTIVGLVALLGYIFRVSMVRLYSVVGQAASADRDLQVLIVLHVSLTLVCILVLFSTYQFVQHYVNDSKDKEQRLEREVLERTADVTQQIRLREAFLCNVLSSVTNGKFHLCRSVQSLPICLVQHHGEFVLTKSNLAEMRHRIASICSEHEFSRERTDAIVTSSGEAMMNAVCHAGCGSLNIYSDEESVQVVVKDRGNGIPLDHLPYATLQAGWSSKGTLGMGFSLMLGQVDRLSMKTDTTGTTVVLLVARYSDPLAYFDELLTSRVDLNGT